MISITTFFLVFSFFFVIYFVCSLFDSIYWYVFSLQKYSTFALVFVEGIACLWKLMHVRETNTNCIIIENTFVLRIMFPEKKTRIE